MTHRSRSERLPIEDDVLAKTRAPGISGTTSAVVVPPGFRNPLAPVTSPPPTLLPLIGANAELTPALERHLHPVAVRALHGDREARDALYRAFEPKLRRFVRRIPTPYAPAGSQGLWDSEDVSQEGYLVFVTLIDHWSPQIPFGPYILANFRWRLHDAVFRRVARRGVPPRTTSVSLDAIDAGPDHASPDAADDSLIAVLAGALEPPLDTMFRLCIVEGLSITRAGRRIGLSDSTARRHWRAIVIRLRAAERAARDCTPSQREGR